MPLRYQIRYYDSISIGGIVFLGTSRATTVPNNTGLNEPLELFIIMMYQATYLCRPLFFLVPWSLIKHERYGEEPNFLKTSP
jgi:surface polysaccharide O-acyltransferase-like enzyme